MADVTVKGLKELQRKIEKEIRELHGDPMLDAVRDAAMMVEGAAKKNLVGYRDPIVGGVDSGRLRASITPEVRGSGNVVMGVVGSNLTYAPHVEYGTGPHWPPIKALETWARRHGTSAYVVARAIARRGTYGKAFLQKAFYTSRDRIIARIQRAVKEITGQ